MKRTPLTSSRPDRREEPGRREWKAPAYGRCAGCGTRGLLVRHHIVLEQHVRAAGGDPWDQRNALQLGAYACRCHASHHAWTGRLPRTILPEAALEFAVQLLGESAARAYLERFYSP